MKILIVQPSTIPVTFYGGTERVIWYLGKELRKMNHQVHFLVKKGSTCDFAKVSYIDEQQSIASQIPDDIDVVHFNYIPKDLEHVTKPYIVTMHGNPSFGQELDYNTVFVSQNHAARHGSESFVYNGLDWDDYTAPEYRKKGDYFHFLGKAAWRIKNARGAIQAVKNTKNSRIYILGGKRFNVKMGLSFTFTPRAKFFNRVGGSLKDNLLMQSKGLVFPVRWHEPFGLAIVESLYYGCPVFGTPYGSLSEIVNHDVGLLSIHSKEITQALEHVDTFSKERCHDYAQTCFNSKNMALAYIQKYEQVLHGAKLNTTKPTLIEHVPTPLEWLNP